MKKILAIMRKDTRLRFSSPMEWLFFLILPVVFTLVLAGGTGAPSDSDSRIRLVVVDQAQSPLSQELTAALEESPSIRPEERSLAEAEAEFSEGSAAAVLILPPRLDQAQLEQGGVELELRQQPNNTDALIAQQAVMAAVERVGSVVDIARRSVEAAERIRLFESAGARSAYFEAALAEAQAQMEQAPERVKSTRGATQDQVEYDPRANSSAGQLITWVFIPLLAISSAFAYERQNGTLRRFLTTPTHKAAFLFGTITGHVATALVQMLLLVGFGVLVMRLNWGQAPAGLGLMLVTTALAGAALGTTLGTFVKSEGQASGLSILLGMMMALLGGCWYPLELFPAVVRTAVMVLPTRWAMQGMLDIVLRGQGLAAVLPEAAVLLGFAAVFFITGMLRFRYE